MAGSVGEDYPLERPGREAGVPHRFGIGVLLILVTFFSVLFAAMTSCGVPPEYSVLVGILFVAVAVGQSLLDEGTSPRAASIIVGSVLLPLEVMGVFVYQNLTGRFESVGGILIGALFAVLFGGPLGYLAGIMTSGIFLVMNGWSTRSRRAEATVELQPFAASDIDTLVGWVHSPVLLRCWSRGLFHVPLDRQQMERHLQRAAGPEPELLAFKAVSPATGRMVGYVELRDVNRPPESATVDLALIAPDEPNRDWLSVRLLQAILAVAFGQMRLQVVQARVPAYESEPRGCYQALGFYSRGILRQVSPGGVGRGDERVMWRVRSEWLYGVRTRYGRPPGAGKE